MHNAPYVYEAGRPRRKSSFQELIDDDEPDILNSDQSAPGSRPQTRRLLSNISEMTNVTVSTDGAIDDSDLDSVPEEKEEARRIDPTVGRMRLSGYALCTKLSFLAVVLALAISLVQNTGIVKPGQSPLPLADAGPIRHEARGVERDQEDLFRRANSQTAVCKRWAGQSAVVNGTLYYFGGRAINDGDQTDNEWNNDFLTLDLTKTWQIGSPAFNGLPQPSGPPAVSEAYLWNSHDSLYLYGGEFSEAPVASPVAFAMWEYDIAGKAWKEHNNPQTSAGENSEGAGTAVHRVAEGAGVNVPNMGRGYYFGGHSDFLTTQGWPEAIGRVYIRGMLEFNFPGASNDAVTDLSGGKTAGSDGAWRNITKAGLQETGGFTERADGILVYVPGFGKQGILLALGGGTNDTFVRTLPTVFVFVCEF